MLVYIGIIILLLISPWIIPVYKYWARLNDVAPYYKIQVLFSIFLILAFGWAVCTAFMISPHYIGVSITCVVECIAFVLITYSNTYAFTRLSEIKGYID